MSQDGGGSGAILQNPKSKTKTLPCQNPPWGVVSLGKLKVRQGSPNRCLLCVGQCIVKILKTTYKMEMKDCPTDGCEVQVSSIVAHTRILGFYLAQEDLPFFWFLIAAHSTSTCLSVWRYVAYFPH